MKLLTITDTQLVSGSGPVMDAVLDVAKAVGEAVGSIVGAAANENNGLTGAYACAKTGIGCSS